jgi:hypothetical protein
LTKIAAAASMIAGEMFLRWLSKSGMLLYVLASALTSRTVQGMGTSSAMISSQQKVEGSLSLQEHDYEHLAAIVIDQTAVKSVLTSVITPPTAIACHQI